MSRYYVYELIDPRTDEVFYVGKGQRNRYAYHRREAISGKYSRKCLLIRDIIAFGLEYKHRIVARFVDEAEAYAFEKRHVASFGLANLTNVAPGGGGLYIPQARELSPVERAQRVVAQSYKFIRRVLIFKHAGIHLWWKDFDFIQICVDLSDQLREAAGADYFDDRVGRFEMKNGPDGPLLSITAVPEFAHAI